MVRTLEAWLGVHHAGTFSPQEEQIARLEGYVHQFNTCAAAVLRQRLLAGFFGAVALAAVLLAFFGKIPWAFGAFGLALEATLAYFVLDGVARKGHLFGRTRRFLTGLGLGDWVVVVAGFAMFCVLLALLKVLWIWIGFGLVGIGLAFALRYGIDRRLANERRAVTDGCERQLRRMRANGLDEEELRQFVAKFAGRDWEEFFEALFGYDAKLAARGVLLRGGAAGARDKHAAWREPLLAAMERIETARKDARERKLLLAVERANLLATGATAQAAEDQASAAADAMVRAADEIRRAETDRAAPGHRTGQAPANVRTWSAPRSGRTRSRSCPRRNATRSATWSRCSSDRTSARSGRHCCSPRARCGRTRTDSCRARRFARKRRKRSRRTTSPRCNNRPRSTLRVTRGRSGWPACPQR